MTKPLKDVKVGDRIAINPGGTLYEVVGLNGTEVLVLKPDGTSVVLGHTTSLLKVEIK